MPILETFAKRMRKRRGEVLDVFQYESAPNRFRVQIVQIMLEALGEDYSDRRYDQRHENIYETYHSIVARLRRELGVFTLPAAPAHANEPIRELVEYILNEQDIEELLSAIELVCKAIERLAREFDYRHLQNAEEISKDALNEINGRFLESGLGFEYNNGEIIRIDSELVHDEVVKPALKLLSNKRFSGAQQEFLSAYEHYRKNKNKEALNDALKALESTLKIIFDRRGWQYDAKRDTSSKLIEIALDHNLIPEYWQGLFGGLMSTLKSGVSTARNRNSGHGQGATPKSIPPHLVAYVLHMTAAAIIFLVKSDEAIG